MTVKIIMIMFNKLLFDTDIKSSFSNNSLAHSFFAASCFIQLVSLQLSFICNGKDII